MYVGIPTTVPLNNFIRTLYQHIPKTFTVMAAPSLPIVLVTVHVYVPISLVVTLSME